MAHAANAVEADATLITWILHEYQPMDGTFIFMADLNVKLTVLVIYWPLRCVVSVAVSLAMSVTMTVSGWSSISHDRDMEGC
ncbi:hypothetical protein N7463_002382 [Penicillium fimorum]|uniref:Uncharacterized protein n=1 Tax=Penicillium fimorum TaxID=1882269 RepID=A0A9W9XZQ6_9EURO|nr:hypothetical protein N7463_002382 [Penicillium fimorum]